MSVSVDARRKRARFRCWHRGSREADLLLGAFADRHIADLDGRELDDLEALLDQADADIWNWVVGRTPAPVPFDTTVLERLIWMSTRLQRQ